ncbi:MAG: single-stranded-DNA-specific exonuclease RecJ [Defluviicoccus sp.]|nr:single-stranded-DNA-specific exonuclease RecJ [Defluviicoccus sp.]MDE0384534.1 single-stranded-DNA-specific exonuclease RecJ [Defluviicoccus sp.]
MAIEASAADSAFLDVDRSVTGKRWHARTADDRRALAIAEANGLPEIVARVLAGRGIESDRVDEFLNPTLRSALPDPSTLRDMDRACERVVRAINDGERLGVFADYDVDGATSAALLSRFFASIGHRLAVYVPDRMKEGYGPNAGGLRALRGDGVSVVIAVDCGTTAHQPLAEAAAIGLDVIVLDHHVAEAALPEAVAVVNPNRLDEDNDCRQLAAVGVAFLFAVAVNRALREAHWYGEGHPEPNLMAWLDLVALGTVCDVVPLTGVNRALVAQGLKIMARRGNPGIAALADIARIDERPTAYHAGFMLGPRVNAGGRVGESGLGARLLSIDDPAAAAEIAARLEGYNRERREIEAGVLERAIDLADAQDAAADVALEPVVLVAEEGWHAGVIGIVASRLRERFNRPACVLAVEGGIAKGSGRSIPGAALGSAVIAARQAGLLIAGGGHAMAAGFTVATDRIAELKAFLDDHVARQLGHRIPAVGLAIDGALTPTGATAKIVEALEAVGPFGTGNPRPRFALPRVRVARADVVGTDHVRCFLVGTEGGPRLKGIAFRSAGTALGDALLATGGAPLHLAGHLRADRWQGRDAVEFAIEDAARL